MKYKYNKVLIISDNEYILKEIIKIIERQKIEAEVHFNYSYTGDYKKAYENINDIKKIDVKKERNYIINNYDLVFSAHCKQIFPIELVNKIKCINIHPGYNPYNRGWFPHVFSILNGLPAGATIHEMDEFIDNGPIIIQEKEKIKINDTSESLYKRILNLEVKLFEKVIIDILKSNYNTYKNVNVQGNINYKKDYEKLKRINIDGLYKGKEFINLLRALSHNDYKNAFFISEDGKKVFLKVELEEEKEK